MLNGINGLVVHKTDRATVIQNVVWDNGKVSKKAPELRQPYAGLTLNHAKDVEVKNNFVKTESKHDYAYAMMSSSLNQVSNWNKLCKVDHTSGSGYGKVASAYGSKIRTATWTECMDAINA